jgi:hypothetical protein
MVASGLVDAAGDQEIIELAKLAESSDTPDKPDACHIRVTEPGTGRVVYETPAS